MALQPALACRRRATDRARVVPRPSISTICCASRHQERVLAESPGIAISSLCAMIVGGQPSVVGAACGIDDRHGPVVLRLAVPGREDGDHFVGCRESAWRRSSRCPGAGCRSRPSARCRPGSWSRDDGSPLGSGRRIPSADRGSVRRAAPRACCRARCWRRWLGCCRRRASQRCRTATWVTQQLTQRLQRLETKTMSPSGR